MDMLKQLSLAGLVPVIKVKKAEDAVPLCRALKNGGLPVAEITFRTDAAEEAIRLVHQALPDVLLGAGTVLTCDQADRAWNAGAGYIVSPGLNPVVVQHCIDKGYPVLPGCANPSDIESALSLGLKTVKFFPAEALGGLKLIKAMAAPYGDVKFVPTGGINAKNLPEYLAFPKIAACGGSWMVPDDAIEAKDWDLIERLAREAVNVMLGLRLKHIGINNPDAETAVNEAKKLCALMGWQPERDTSTSLFVGDGFEMMKSPFRGTHGHIAIGTANVDRAKWHLEQRGFAFDEDTALFTPDGRMKFIYLKDEIAGFALHLTLA
ncbi:MAG: bifunctional 4-hydroxy-2-oxoglutarate aldolase/2-dehydro-3-deoxy-phosphogluconate aldolase [Clostridiales bacterium]|nr:bifunctional 4-hydroxy-2-oxoglutarate aldolase/2-dehydro-3-deoxy-phosphogluconate aldolase [Clostridiales bacterium]